MSSSRLLASLSKTLKLNPNQAHPNPNPTSYLLTSHRCLSTQSALASSTESQGNERGRLSRWLLFLPGVITFGLGSWQIVRRQDKIEMLEYRKHRLGLEPLTLNGVPSSLSEDSDPLEFRRVLCEGVFDESKSIYVGPRSRSISGVTENGYYLVTPLMPIAEHSASVRAPVLVNRGWVPRSWRDKYMANSPVEDKYSTLKVPTAEKNEGSHWWKFWSKTPKTVKEEGPVINPDKVIGVVRGSEKPSIFVPANDPSSGQWFYIDVPMIARSSGLPENTVYIEDINEDIDPSKPYPLPKDINTLIRSSVMPQDHLNYTLTWYSLSAAVTFMAIKRLKTKKSRR